MIQAKNKEKLNQSLILAKCQENASFVGSPAQISETFDIQLYETNLQISMRDCAEFCLIMTKTSYLWIQNFSNFGLSPYRGNSICVTEYLD